MVEGRDGGGVHIVIYTYRHIARLGARSESVLSRKKKNMAIEMTLNQGRLVQPSSTSITMALVSSFRSASCSSRLCIRTNPPIEHAGREDCSWQG